MPGDPRPTSLAVARAAAAAAESCPGVVRLHGGSIGERATYGPGGVVRGVAVNHEAGVVTVWVVARLDQPLLAVADEVRDRVVTAAAAVGFADLVVDVHIADVALDTEEMPEDGAAEAVAPGREASR